MFVGTKAFVEVVVGFCVVERWDSGYHDEEDDGSSKEVNSGSVVLNAKVDFWGHVGFGSEVSF